MNVIYCLVPIFLFVILGTEHIVANFTFLAHGVIDGAISLPDTVRNIAAVTAGNFVGGTIIAVAAAETGAARKA